MVKGASVECLRDRDAYEVRLGGRIEISKLYKMAYTCCTHCVTLPAEYTIAIQYTSLYIAIHIQHYTAYTLYIAIHSPSVCRAPSKASPKLCSAWLSSVNWPDLEFSTCEKVSMLDTIDGQYAARLGMPRSSADELQRPLFSCSPRAARCASSDV